MERPICFAIEGKGNFKLYPSTIGKNYLLSRQMDSLGIDVNVMRMNPYAESYRLCCTNTDTVCSILAYHTFTRKDDILDSWLIRERASLLSSSLDKDEMATLFMAAITRDDVPSYIRCLGLDREHDKRRRVIESKKAGSCNVDFCGKSIYGTMIDWACQRYGWTFDYVVWGISYVNLQMLMADAITSVYLSQEERMKLRVFGKGEVIDAGDPKNRDRIKEMLKDQ